MQNYELGYRQRPWLYIMLVIFIMNFSISFRGNQSFDYFNTIYGITIIFQLLHIIMSYKGWYNMTIDPEKVTYSFGLWRKVSIEFKDIEEIELKTTSNIHPLRLVIHTTQGKKYKIPDLYDKLPREIADILTERTHRYQNTIKIFED